MADLRTAALSEDTWPAFAELVERHNGVWGGCWCMAFHAEGVGKGHTPEGNRAAKHARVLAGTTHSALVMDGDECVGWCQFGPCAELPRIKSRRAYESSLVQLPDWRITCFFVDRGRRGEGIANRALAGAVELIAGLGGGVTEGYPEDVAGRTTSGSFLFNGTTDMFAAVGFDRSRQIAKHRWVMTRTITEGTANGGEGRNS